MGAGLFMAGVVPLANMLSEGHAVPWYWNVAQEWLQRGAMIGLALLVLSFFAGQRLEDFLQRMEAMLLRPSSTAFGLTLSGVAVMSAAIVSAYAFSGEPFTSDEMAQAWHAHVLASGHLFARAEAVREFFNTAPVLDTNGRWFSQYPVGGPALIALGVWIHAPWVVNPVLTGIAALALYRFFASMGDELRARGAALLFVSSPMVLEMGGSQMNHVAALTGAAIALWGWMKWRDATEPRVRALAAGAIGAALGALATVRPLDAALVALLVGGAQLWRAIREPSRWLSIGLQAVVGAVPVAALLWANAQTTGSATLFGYEALNGAAHGLGFHVDPTGDMHTPLRGLILMSGYLMKLSMYLFEWPLPGVLVIVGGILAIRRPSGAELLLAGLVVAFGIAYGAYWFDGFFAGPRFLFTVVPAFIYFAVRMPGLGTDAHPVVRRALALVLPVCVLMAWLGPWGATSASSRIALYREQRTKLKTPIERQVQEAGIHHALVFVTEGWRGELMTRLRVLGATQFKADRLASTLDACGLQMALDAEARAQDPDSVRLARVVQSAQALGVARPVPDMPADQAIFLVPGTSPTPRCLAAFSRDSIGTMPYAMFLARQHVDADGRIGGDIVFARDLGERNEE
ncbi:MAG TPA: hypothetical protein VF483_03005, partial [Gemmatimonadaceae bacterium]